MSIARRRYTPTRRLVAAAVAVSAAGFGATAVNAGAGAAPLVPAGAQQVTRVTVFLKAPRPPALAKLAQAHGLDRAQRLAAVQSLVPDAATRAAVARELGAEGLTVTHESTWSLTATAAARTVAAAFGTRPTLAHRPSAADYLASTGSLPSLPSALAGHVSAVFPTAAGPAVLHHMATSTLNGTDFRNADTPADVSPLSGRHDAGTTIATVQFADFDHNGTSDAAASDAAADLVSYAAEHQLPNPVATGRYQAVRIDGGPSATDDAQGGDVEVDLDQESILSTAPTADQHPYFAPNTDAGFGDVFSAVYDDVVGDSLATAPDPNITALSSSWGECEGDTGADAINAVEPLLESLTAAGVTVFSAAGDDGIYDCGSTTGLGVDDTQADVDFPASSPDVVGVGGTNLSASASAPNTGTNWSETAWSCTTAFSCESTAGTGGSGGGESGSAAGTSSTATFAGFAAPTYQQATVTDAPFAGAPNRLVPDIAADGDPSTGFDLYTSDPQDVLEAGGSNDLTVGGTSLAAPISAAQFDDALGDAGITEGVGDIHDALYTAYAQTNALASSDPLKVFRDVISGTNGRATDEGADPSVSAQAGYDTVSGLGGVLWSALVPYLTASGTPSASGTLTEPTADDAADTYAVDGAWQVGTPADNRTITGTAVSVENDKGAVVYRTRSTAASGTFGFTGTGGRTYTLAVTPTDLAGTSSTGTARLVTPIDDRGFAVSRGWTRASRTTDFGGSHLRGSAATLTAKATGTGRTFKLRVLTGPSAGEVGVYLAGRLVKSVDTYATRTVHRTVTVYHSPTRAKRTFTFKPLRRKNAKSKGTAVSLDDVVVNR